MPDRDPSKVQLDFPLLNADLIRQLRLTGQIGVMDFDPVVRPVFIIGDRGISIEVEQPVYEPAGIIDGSVNNAVAGSVLLDTGQLAGGIFDFKIYMSASLTTGAPNLVQVQHRNAANTATLDAWEAAITHNSTMIWDYEFALLIALNERIRISVTATVVGRIATTIMSRRRLTP